MLSIPFLYFLMDKEANPCCPWPGLWLRLCPKLRLRAVVVESNIEAEITRGQSEGGCTRNGKHSMVHCPAFCQLKKAGIMYKQSNRAEKYHNKE